MQDDEISYHVCRRRAWAADAPCKLRCQRQKQYHFLRNAIERGADRVEDGLDRMGDEMYGSTTSTTRTTTMTTTTTTAPASSKR